MQSRKVVTTPSASGFVSRRGATSVKRGKGVSVNRSFVHKNPSFRQNYTGFKNDNK